MKSVIEAKARFQTFRYFRLSVTIATFRLSCTAMAPKRGYTTNEENTPDIVQEEKPSSSDATKNEENTEKPSSSDATKKQEITEKPSSSDATKKQKITEKPSSSDATKSINGMTKIEKEQSQVLVTFKFRSPETSSPPRRRRSSLTRWTLRRR